MEGKLLDRVVDLVFPPGSTLSYKTTEESPLQYRFWILYSQFGPRWILPCAVRQGSVVFSRWRPYSAVSLVKWTVIRSLYGLNLLGHLPGVRTLSVVVLNKDDWSHLGLKGQKSILPVIYIGTPGPRRKVVVGLVDSVHCKWIGACKVPITPVAASSILHEANVIAKLSEEKPGLAPTPIFVDKEKGILLQSVVEGRLVGRRLSKKHISWLLGLKNGKDTSVREQIIRLDLIGKEVSYNISKALFLLDDSTRVPTVWVHGDFAPWNLKLGPGGEIAAVDWEDALPDGLPLYDLSHFFYIQAFLFGRKTYVFRMILNNPLVLKYLSLMKVPYELARKLVLFYLVASLKRCLGVGKKEQANFLLAEIVRYLKTFN